MAQTSSELVAARIYEVNDEGKDAHRLSVPCMFNPFEYTVSKTNNYGEEGRNRSTIPQFEFKKSGPQTLKLSLTFDTYENRKAKDGTTIDKDVSKITSKLWKFMEPRTSESGNRKSKPPQVAFEWGVFCFVAVITNMTQKFTLFTKEGTPVRAKVDVTFTQHVDVNDYSHQNPTSGGGSIHKVWRVIGGDRLDTIAAAVYGDATRWRIIADYNGITNPLAVRPGQQLTIPQE